MTVQMLNKQILLFFAFFSINTVKAEIQSELNLSDLSFISEDFENTEDSNYVFIGAKLKSELGVGADARSQEDLFKIDLTGKYASGNSILSYLNVKELYFTYFIDDSASIHIGRKLNTWSVGEEMWNLGLYQPQFRWNPLDVENQGLFGIFYEKKSGDLQLNLFGTPFYIPDQGPNYEFKDGQFAASNPYFTPPPQSILFQSVLLPIDYNIIKPEFSDIVLQSGFGIQIKYQDSQGWFANLAGTYKPSNQIAFGYKGILVTNRVRVDLLPKTYYEKIISLDLAKHGEWGRVGTSILHNEPENPEYTSDYNTPIFEPNTTVAPYIRFDFKPIELEFSELFIENGDVTESGPDTTADRQPLTHKYLYNRAYQISANYRQLVTENLRILSSVQWLDTEKNLLQTLKFRNIFDIKGPWKLTLDLFLVETGEEPSAVSNYRNLDQVWVGASYDF